MQDSQNAFPNYIEQTRVSGSKKEPKCIDQSVPQYVISLYEFKWYVSETRTFIWKKRRSLVQWFGPPAVFCIGYNFADLPLLWILQILMGLSSQSLL